MALWGTLGGRSLVEPEKLAVALAESDPPGPTDWLPLVNRYACPIGLSPGRGHVLLLKSDLDALDLTGKLALVFADTDGKTLTFPNMRAVGHPRCLSFGAPDPCYLVEIADCRVDLVGATAERYQWKYHPNDPSSTTGTDTPLNWGGLAAALWAELPTLGNFPGLPTAVPNASGATLDRLDLHAFPLRYALEDVLSALGCAAAYDPIGDTWSIVYLPSAADNADTIRLRYTLIYDERPYAPKDFGPVPGQICVLFGAWLPGRSNREPRLYYSVPVTPTSDAPIDSSISTVSSGIAYIQDYTPARTLPDGTVQNDTLLGLRGAQVGRIWYDRFAPNAARKAVRQAFSGLIQDYDVRPGGTYDLVSWSIGVEGPVTAVARAGMTGTVPLYEGEPPNGLQSAIPTTLDTDDNGVPFRAGGLIPSPDRLLDAEGDPPDRRWVSAAGPAAGPLFRTASALRQGDWHTIGSGGRADWRARLWRNWEDPPTPHDMDRILAVTSGPTSVSFSGVFHSVYLARPMRQEGWPPDWPPDEGCYLVGANLEPLVIGRAYLCRGAHTRADDGKRLWATFCCDGGSGQFASLVDGVTDDRPSPGSIGAKGACKACSPVTGIDVNGNVQPIVLPPRIKVTLSPQPVDLVPPACVDIQSAPCFAYWPPTPFYFTQTPVTFFVDRVGNGSSTPYSYPFRLELNAANISTCTTVGTYTIRHKAIGCSDTTGSIVANPYILFDGAFACLPCCSPCNPDATQGCTPYPNGGPPWGTGYRLGNGLVFNGIATTTGPSLSLPPPNCDNYPSVYGACPNTEQVRILSFNPLHVQMLAGYYCMFDIQGVPCATV